MLPEYRVEIRPADAGDRPIEWRDFGRRTKLGGEPTWLQGDETPVCEGCNRAMTFVAQIDSFYYPGDAGELESPEFMFGDVGMLYLFVCGCSMRTASLYQGG